MIRIGKLHRCQLIKGNDAIGFGVVYWLVLIGFIELRVISMVFERPRGHSKSNRLENRID